MPATPTRITSLAPSTRPDDLVPAMVTSGKTEPAAAACLRNLRLVILCMGYSRVRGLEGPPKAALVMRSSGIGYGTVSLWAVSALTATARPYRRFGFEKVQERPARQWGVQVVEERYVLALR